MVTEATQRTRAEAPAELATGQLVRNCLAEIDRPFTQRDLVFICFNACERLRRTGFNPTVGFGIDGGYGPDAELRQSLYSPTIDEEFWYWAGHGFTRWDVPTHRWSVPEDKQRVLKQDVAYGNSIDFNERLRTILTSTVAQTIREVLRAEQSHKADL